MFEIIVLGATFTAAGIVNRHKKKCLVIERRMQAGYEFFGALNFGCNYEKTIKSNSALLLKEKFCKEKSLFSCESLIYPYFNNTFTLFGTQIVSVAIIDGVFTCTTHGTSGYRTFKAKNIIDTRCDYRTSVSKTYNFLIESDTEPIIPSCTFTKVYGENRYVIHCPVPLSCSYSEARNIILPIIKNFSKGQRLILLANEFDYRTHISYPKKENDIIYIPSKEYDNPILAFEAGTKAGKEFL